MKILDKSSTKSILCSKSYQTKVRVAHPWRNQEQTRAMQHCNSIPLGSPQICHHLLHLHASRRRETNKSACNPERLNSSLGAHDCGYPLSRYTCRATRVAANFLDFIAFCRCSTGVALHPLKILVSHLPPPCAGRCRTEIWVWKGVALHGGVAATVAGVALHCATKNSRYPHHIAKHLSKKISQNGVSHRCFLAFMPYRAGISEASSCRGGRYRTSSSHAGGRGIWCQWCRTDLARV